MPFALLYRMVTGFRNHLYNLGIKPSVQFDLPTICVGNLSVGGTGKTPHIEYLVYKLKSQYKIATLSRGYGRKTKGPIIASNTDTAESIGDEPLQFYQKFSPEVTVAVGEERVIALPQILQDHPETEAVLLDDAYQHRKLRASYYILLTTFQSPFFKDFLLPTGLLREGRIGAKRADAILVTKCPNNLSKTQIEAYKKAIGKYAPHAPVFFTSIQYGAITALSEYNTEMPKSWQLVTGIANAKPLLEYLDSMGMTFQHSEFSDHHFYTEEEVENIISRLPPERGVLLTEKDAVKWNSKELKALWARVTVFYLPIEVEFLEEEEAFLGGITQHIKSFAQE